MEKLENTLSDLYLKITCAWNVFVEDEKGDTNFVSMLIIIAIVLVLAGLFMTFGKTIMDAVELKVTTFINGLNPNTAPQ